MVGENPIDFLRHPAIEGTEAGFDVNHWNVQFGGGKRTGECGISVTIYKHSIRLAAKDFRFQ